MDTDTMNTLRVEQLDSYGRLMASFSHEMKNHLGIIRESSGLIADLLLMHGGQLDDRVKTSLDKSAAAIEQRIVKAARAFHHLSGFAHRSDAPLSSFQPDQLVEESCLFFERFARLAQVSFTQRAEEGVPAVHNDPALLHHVLYRLFNFCLDALQPGDAMEIIIAPAKGNGTDAQVSFQCSRGGKTGQELPEQLAAPLELLQASCKIVCNDEERVIEVEVPSLSF